MGVTRGKICTFEKNRLINMKKLLFVMLLAMVAPHLFAQDIDVYTLKKNSNFVLPSVNKDMSYDEFQLLSRNLRMQDMLYAMLVPGYTHYVAKDNKMGNWMLAARMTGYSGLAYVLFKNDYSLTALLTGTSINRNKSSFKTQRAIALSSVGIIFAEYFFDWIHAKWVLEKKQEKIRYKYSIQMSLGAETSYLPGQGMIPGVHLRCSFN